jgi:hypothetical protein
LFITIGSFASKKYHTIEKARTVKILKPVFNNTLEENDIRTPYRIEIKTILLISITIRLLNGVFKRFLTSPLPINNIPPN